MLLLPRLFNRPSYEPFQQPKLPPLPTPQATRPGVVHTAPGTAIAHDPELVARLRWQHAWLQQSLEAIQTDVASGQFSYAQRALKLFRRALMTHLLEERVRMYTYVAKCLAQDADATRSMLAVKSEMDAAGTVAMDFADAYVLELTPDNKTRFLTELRAVRMALADRIDWEEASLYGLYLPPEAYR